MVGGDDKQLPRAAPRQETRAAAAMVVGSIFSVQCGAALATTLFDRIGAGGAVFLRSAFAAALLLGVSHRHLPDLRGHLRDIVLFGVVLAGMNFSFYAAIEHLPLGVTVTLEFVGPLAVAVFGSRRRRDLIWALVAATGLVLLSDGFGSGGFDTGGVLLAFLAGGFWAVYILLAARVGRTYPGLGGLAAAMVVSALCLIPFGIGQGGGELLSSSVLAAGLAVGLLSSAIPYALELEALRRLPSAVFGVLVSLEPAAAALVGFVALSQDLGLAEVVAIALVVCASVGALRSAGAPVPRDG